ncbi:MAG: hypothetical protein LBO63_01140 [Oscillospiraceae bacterium]|nr:hypothetical protein [Oscillospiraceae bacterium]
MKKHTRNLLLIVIFILVMGVMIFIIALSRNQNIKGEETVEMKYESIKNAYIENKALYQQAIATLNNAKYMWGGTRVIYSNNDTLYYTNENGEEAELNDEAVNLTLALVYEKFEVSQTMIEIIDEEARKEIRFVNIIKAEENSYVQATLVFCESTTQMAMYYDSYEVLNDGWYFVTQWLV